MVEGVEDLMDHQNLLMVVVVGVVHQGEEEEEVVDTINKVRVDPGDNMGAHSEQEGLVDSPQEVGAPLHPLTVDLPTLVNANILI